MESECKVLLDKIHRKIRKLYQNVFIFMRAAPIVEAIPKENSRENINMESQLILTTKKSKDVIEEPADPRKFKRKDSKRVSMVNPPKKFLNEESGIPLPDARCQAHLRKTYWRN